MAWLVAVRVLPDEAARVAVDLARSGGQTEILVKFLQKRLFASEKVYQTLRILRHKPHVLPCITLNKTRLLVAERIETFHPVAVFVFRTEKSSLRVEKVLVKHAAAIETLVIFNLS